MLLKNKDVNYFIRFLLLFSMILTGACRKVSSPDESELQQGENRSTERSLQSGIKIARQANLQPVPGREKGHEDNVDDSHYDTQHPAPHQSHDTTVVTSQYLQHTKKRLPLPNTKKRLPLPKNPFDDPKMAHHDLPQMNWFLTQSMPQAFALVIHGMMNVPEEMYPIANKLHENGIETVVLSLGGHKGGPKGKTGIMHWITQIMSAYEIVKQRAGCKPVYIVAYSMGGALTVFGLLSKSINPLPEKVVLLTPAIAFNKKGGALKWYISTPSLKKPKEVTRHRIKIGKRWRSRQKPLLGNPLPLPSTSVLSHTPKVAAPHLLLEPDDEKVGEVLHDCAETLNNIRRYLDAIKDYSILRQTQAYVIVGDKDEVVSGKEVKKWLDNHALRWKFTGLPKVSHKQLRLAHHEHIVQWLLQN